MKLRCAIGCLLVVPTLLLACSSDSEPTPGQGAATTANTGTFGGSGSGTMGQTGAGEGSSGNATVTSGSVGSAVTNATVSGTSTSSSTGTGGAENATATTVGGATSSVGGTTSNNTSSGGSASGGNSGTSGGGTNGTGPSPASIIIQDNFDSMSAGGPPDATKWAAYPQGQESLGPVLDSARARSGSNAARVQSTSSGLGSFLVPASGPLGGDPVTGNAYYVRVFINWQKATSEISGHSGFLVGSAARENNGTEARLGISSKGPNNVPRLDLNLQSPSDGGGETTRYSNGYTDGGNPADFPATGFQFAADTWYCVEAFFNGTATGSEFRVWIDSAEIPEMHVTDFRGNMNGEPRTAWAPTYQYIKIGAQDYDANLGQIWYDDVVVATEPIGCDYAVP